MVYQCNHLHGLLLPNGFNFQRHMLSHSQPRQFACQQCPMKFNLRQHLNRHIKAKHTPKPVVEVVVTQKKARIEDIINNDQGLSFFHDPAIPEEPYESIFNWEPTAKDDVAANLDQLSAMLEGKLSKNQSKSRQLKLKLCPPGQFRKQLRFTTTSVVFAIFTTSVLLHLQRTRKRLHPARCCFFCGKVKFVLELF